ncbi:MAG: thioredoxin-related protein [Candidatus Azotimanducaceae bacterium]|jgi:thioredoxin-related protein
MRRKHFITGIFLILISISCKTKKTTIKATENIPYFTFTSLDNSRFTQDNFDKSRTKFIMYFNSECDHCQKQASWIANDIETFKNFEITFISYEEMEAIKSFRDKHNFKQDNITFLQDSRLTFSDKFGVETFPSILFYTKDGKLIKKFEGETKVKEILEHITP